MGFLMGKLLQFVGVCNIYYVILFLYWLVGVLNFFVPVFLCGSLVVDSSSAVIHESCASYKEKIT